MKLKTLVALMALTAGTAFAEVVTGNTLCRIEVASGTKTTVISVPLVQVGGGNVDLTKLVLTDNLDGATMFRKKGDKWDAWEVKNGEWEAILVSEGNKASISPNPQNTAVARGEAFVITRAGTVTSETPSFYLYGQFSEDATPVQSGITVTGWTLIGNPNPAVYDLALANSWTGCATGDMIKVPDNLGIGEKTYSYSEDDGWKALTYENREVTIKRPGQDTATAITVREPKRTELGADDVIPAGQGFWYITKSATPTVTIDWTQQTAGQE